MYTSETRARLLDELIERAGQDPRIIAAAIVGSAARDEADAWSDIDLAFRLAPGLVPATVADSWTRFLSDHVDHIDHLDVWSGAALYRVFLLADSLQVDLSFWPTDHFTRTSPSFRLLFGESNPANPMLAPSPKEVLGTGWLYAIHVRSSIARGRHWQALHMIDTTREQLITLACLRLDLPWREGRGVDILPPDLLTALEATIVTSLRAPDLVRVFSAVIDLLIDEAEYIDTELASRLRVPLGLLVTTAVPPRNATPDE